MFLNWVVLDFVEKFGYVEIVVEVAIVEMTFVVRIKFEGDIAWVGDDIAKVYGASDDMGSGAMSWASAMTWRDGATFQLQTHYTTSLEDWMASMGDLSRKLIKEHKRGFEEWYLVDLFICGLSPDIKKGVSIFKPKTLSDACCLAKLQESTHNFMVKNSNRPLFYSLKLNDSKERVENNVGLRNHDVRWKNDVECEEIELRKIQVRFKLIARKSTTFSSFHLTGSHEFMNHVGESGDLVTKIVSKGDTLTIKFEKTKASIQVTQENKEDDMVMEDEKIMCLGILDYGVDDMKNNASTIGVSEIGVVDVYDGMFNFSEGDGTSNFNKPVDIIKSVEKRIIIRLQVKLLLASL
nr:hypothetical protein [Tanacetum cinerariifolium]